MRQEVTLGFRGGSQGAAGHVGLEGTRDGRSCLGGVPMLGCHEPGVCQAAGTEAERAWRLPRAEREVQGPGGHWLETAEGEGSPSCFYESG